MAYINNGLIAFYIFICSSENILFLYGLINRKHKKKSSCFINYPVNVNTQYIFSNWPVQKSLKTYM